MALSDLFSRRRKEPDPDAADSGAVDSPVYPTKALTNPVFYLKLVFIAVAVALAVRIGHRIAGADDDRVRRLKGMATLSLLCWAGAIFAGRLLAYTHSRLMAIE